LGAFGALGNRDEANRPLPVTVVLEPSQMAPSAGVAVTP
jgi:hypothetical protein